MMAENMVAWMAELYILAHKQETERGLQNGTSLGNLKSYRQWQKFINVTFPNFS